MYDLMKIMIQFSWVLELIFLINYIWKNDQYPCPWCQWVLYKQKMVNNVLWEELTKIEISENILWIIEILCLGDPSPIKKVEKSKKWQLICFDEYWKFIFLSTPFYIGDFIYLAKIVRALWSNKIVFLHFCKKSTIQ